MFFNYPFELIAGSVLILYVLYVFSAFLFYLNILGYLGNFKEIRRYYAKKWYILPMMPMYNLYIFWIRFAAIINSIRRRSGWRVDPFQEERKRFFAILTGDLTRVTRVITKLRSLVNTN
jgi:poly-beta-1,6-N-acetyl-D-glucosamine synthase